MVDRGELAGLWQSILQADPNRLFGADSWRLEQRSGFGDDLAQPGFVGSRYQRGGILFLAKNPGKGTLPLSAGEERHLSALRGLRSAVPESLLASFERLMDELLDVMPGWGVFQNYVRPIISEAGIAHESVAYINLLKWRSEDARPGMFRRSWLAHTQEQYRLLQPRYVIALGHTTEGIFQDLLRRYGATKPDRLEKVERRRRDDQDPHERTKQHMHEIARRLHDRYGG